MTERRPRPAPKPKSAAQPDPMAQLEQFPDYVIRPVEELIPYARNARTHSDAQVAMIAGSIREFGFTNPVLIDGDRGIVAGHGRVLAARKLRMKTVPCIELKHLTPLQRKAYVLADNQLALKSGWDDEMLAMELGELHEEGFDLGLAGFEPADLDTLLGLNGDGDGAGEEDAPGSLLARTDITIAEPRHQLEAGDHYLLSGRHHLIVASVMKDWPLYVPLLVEGAIFCPYPGVFVPFGKKARDHVLVLVQPDPYIAGHILDRYEDCYGDVAVAKAERVAGATAEPAEAEAARPAERTGDPSDELPDSPEGEAEPAAPQ